MQVPKIQLSTSEIDLVNNRDIILTKNVVLKKIESLLRQVQTMQLEFVRQHLLASHEAFVVGPKISKGENYLGLPYIVLDYPRISGAQNFLFIRTMFWWGNFFSSTLQVGGFHKERVLNQIKANIELIKDYYIGINPDPWQHHFEDNNYIPVQSDEKIRMLSNEQGLIRWDYLKIAGKWPLTDWGEADVRLLESWKILLRLAGLVP